MGKKTTINITRPKCGNGQRESVKKFDREASPDRPSLICQICGCTMVRMGFAHVCHNCGNSVADVH